MRSTPPGTAVNPPAGPAIAHLWSSPAITRNPHARPALVVKKGGSPYGWLDTHQISPNDYAWSSGENAILQLALCLAFPRQSLRLSDLLELDPEHSRYAVEAIALLLGVQE